MPELDAGLIEGYIADRLESAKTGLPPPAFPLSSGQSSANGQNEVLTVISEAQLEDGSTGIISATIKKSEDSQNTSEVSSTAPFQALKWQRNTVSSPSLFTEAMSEFLVKQYAEFEINN
jgi:general secretion pathway protein K